MKLYYINPLLYIIAVVLLLTTCNTLEKTVNPVSGDDLKDAIDLNITKIMVNVKNPDETEKEVEISDDNTVVSVSQNPVWKITFAQPITQQMERTKGRITLYSASNLNNLIELVVSPDPNDVMTVHASLKNQSQILLEGSQYIIEVEKGLKITEGDKTYVTNVARKVTFTTAPNKDSSLKIYYENQEIIPVDNIFLVQISTTANLSSIPLTLNINAKSTVKSCSFGSQIVCTPGSPTAGTCPELMTCDNVNDTSSCNITYHRTNQSSQQEKCQQRINCSENYSQDNGSIENQNFDFSNIFDSKYQRLFAVTAQNGCASHYTVQVNVRSSIKIITSFKFLSKDNPSLSENVVGEVKNELSTVSVTVPIGTTLNNLIPEIIIEGNSITPLSGVAQDFTNTFTYSVKAEDTSSIDYKINVKVKVLSSFKSINSFVFEKDVNDVVTLEEDISADINESNFQITKIVPLGTDLTRLKPIIILSEKSTVSPLSQTPQDFTSPVVYTVTAEDLSTQKYTVTITEKNPIVVIYVNEGVLTGDTEREIQKNTLMNQPVASRVGYNLDGWYTEDTFTNKFNFTATSVNENMSLYAKWNVVVLNWQVSFETDGGGSLAPITVLKGRSINSPEIIVKNGYIFDKWYTEAVGGNAVAFPYTPPQNVMLYARWITKSNTVIFHNDGTETTQTVMSDNLIVEPQNPTKLGFEFEGWFTSNTGGVKYKFDEQKVFSNLDLHARWKPLTYTVKFYNSSDGTDVTDSFTLIDTITVLHEGTVTPSTPSIPAGWKLKGWSKRVYNDVNNKASGYTLVNFDFNSEPITGNTDFETVWEKVIKIRFNYWTSLEGIGTNDVTVELNNFILTPNALSYRNIEFLGWFTTEQGGDKLDFNINNIFTDAIKTELEKTTKVPNVNSTMYNVYAQYNYTVRFFVEEESNDKYVEFSKLPTAKVRSGSTISATLTTIPTPSNVGTKNFSGWVRAVNYTPTFNSDTNSYEINISAFNRSVEYNLSDKVNGPLFIYASY